MSAETAFVKYTFLDVVGFTKERSVEAQSDIIMNMNRIVNDTISSYSIPKENLIVLPTGDGLCIVLLDLLRPFDIHLLVGLGIIERLDYYNSQTTDEKRRFLLRIGISENVDNLITDFNGQVNVAGAGISTAQFVMNQADGNQIIISENVYGTLRHREHYINAFRQYKAIGKHGYLFNVFQYIHPGHTGLNTEVPAFAPKLPVEPKLSRILAYYMVHAIINREIFIAKLKTMAAYITLEYAGIILLYFLACDTKQRFESPSYSIDAGLTWSSGKASFEEQLDYYCKNDLSLLREFSKEIVNNNLLKFHECFERVNFAHYLLINKVGHAKLKNDHPDIWKKFFG
ncbi:MAG: nucleotidyl cyclase domain-containing protein [Desulfobaccales bacterium]